VFPATAATLTPLLKSEKGLIIEKHGEYIPSDLGLFGGGTQAVIVSVFCTLLSLKKYVLDLLFALQNGDTKRYSQAGKP